MDSAAWWKIIAFLSLGSFGLSYAFGWFALQWYFALGIFGVMGAFFFFSHKKETRVVDDPYEIINYNEETLRSLGVWVGSRPRIKNASRVNERLDFDPEGRLWQVTFTTTPTNDVFLFNVKTKKMIGFNLKIGKNKSPIDSVSDRPPPPQIHPTVIKREYKETAKPE